MSDCSPMTAPSKNDRPHAHQHLVANRAGVNDGGMAYGDVIAQDTGEVVRQMQDGVVLDVRVVADDDAVDVAPEHGVAPDARVIAQGHIAQHDGALGDIDAFAEGRLLRAGTCRVLFHQLAFFISCISGCNLTHPTTTAQFEFYSKRSISRIDNDL